MKRRFENQGEIVGASIPDDDMPGWIRHLHEMNLPEGQEDKILARLNENYAKLKGIKKPEGSRMNFIYKTVEEYLGRELTEQEKKNIDEETEKKLFEAAQELGIDLGDFIK